MGDQDGLHPVAPTTAPSGGSMPSKLVVVSTGLWGALWNVEFMRERLQQAGGAGVLVYSAVCNALLNSYSGIDVCGKRLAAEVRSLFNERPDLNGIRSVSFVGYSAGGLYVRYAVGLLHEEGFFSDRGIALGKILSAATPHLGVRSSPRATMGRIKNGLLGVFGNVYGGRSLEQMTLTDKDSPNGDPILLHMSLPGTRYTDALQACQGVFFYANALNDNTVSYCAAAVARVNRYRHLTDIPEVEGFPAIAGVFAIADDEDLRHSAEMSVPDNEPGPSTTARPGAEPLGETRANGSPVKDDIPLAKGGVAAAALAVIVAPILAIQFLTLILPLRIAHSVCTRDEFQGASAKTPPSGDGDADEETGSPAREPLIEGRTERSPGTVGPPEGIPRIQPPGEGKPSASTSSEQTQPLSLVPERSEGNLTDTADFKKLAGDRPVGHVVETMDERGELGSRAAEQLEGGIDGVPAAIRRNLARPELGIRRVDVCLPGLHTHGTIVVRRRYVNRQGKVVIDHMAKLLFE